MAARALGLRLPLSVAGVAGDLRMAPDEGKTRVRVLLDERRLRRVGCLPLDGRADPRKLWLTGLEDQSRADHDRNRDEIEWKAAVPDDAHSSELLQKSRAQVKLVPR